MCYFEGMLYVVDQAYENNAWLKITGIGMPATTFKTQMFGFETGAVIYSGTLSAAQDSTGTFFAP
jgi:hypothetical protein